MHIYLHIVKWFQVLLCNTNSFFLHTVKWFQELLYNVNQFFAYSFKNNKRPNNSVWLKDGTLTGTTISARVTLGVKTMKCLVDLAGFYGILTSVCYLLPNLIYTY